MFFENIDELKQICNLLEKENIDIYNTSIGSVIYAHKPGDGSAREQAASCQKVLGGLANIVREYATKRYRSNLINWGVLPFVLKDDISFGVDDYIFVSDIKNKIINKDDNIEALLISDGSIKKINLTLNELTEKERKIILDGCLINYNKTLIEK